MYNQKFATFHGDSVTPFLWLCFVASTLLLMLVVAGIENSCAGIAIDHIRLR